MIKKLIAVSAVILPLATIGAKADPIEQRVEIPIEKVFAPEFGYDDNDHVEVVVHGNLPSACYKLADTFVETLADGTGYAIRQYAIRIDEGVCTEAAPLPPHMAMMVPFTKVLELGRMNAANYQIRYTQENSTTHIRPFNVGIATAPTIDSMPYAAVSNAMVTDIVSARDDVKVTISGVLNSTCTTLDENLQIKQQKDVIVMLPVLKVKPNTICAQVLVPFRKTVNLGRLAPEEYLVHIRAMNGTSVNRVFAVRR